MRYGSNMRRRRRKGQPGASQVCYPTMGERDCKRERKGGATVGGRQHVPYRAVRKERRLELPLMGGIVREAFNSMRLGNVRSSCPCTNCGI